MKTFAILVGALVLGSVAVLGVGAQGATPTTTFSPQASGGHSVVVSSADLPVAGFVAIHDATLLEGAVFTSVVGVSSFLAAGQHKDVTVHLTRALNGTNETLLAMPHKDSNANRIYDFVSSGGTEDGPFIGGKDAIAEDQLPGPLKGKGLGGISAVVAQANHSASLVARDQTGSGRSVLIDHVDLSVPGYVAVHDATLVRTPDASGIDPAAVLTSVVGVSDLLPAGLHHDVLVQVGNNCGGCRTNGTMNGTLIPMAHKETNGNARYDFVSSNGTQDGPFVGQPGTPLTAVIAIVASTSSAVATETFAPQATGGHIVTFAEVFVPEGGYAAVHDATLLEGNVLGSVIGVSELLAPGIHRNVSVELSFNGSDGLNASTTLIGMLHKESSNNTSYDFVSSGGTVDGPYTGGPNSLAEAALPAALQGKGFGGVNAVPSAVNLSASTRIAAHQDSDGHTVTVEHADLSQDGFIALHDESLLADPGANVMTSVVGVSAALEAGLHRNVTITLGGSGCGGCVKGALNTSQTLIAMPHKDSNTNGVYDFISSKGAEDGPFVTGAAASNTVSALDLNIVAAVGRITTPIVANATAAATPTTPVTPATPTTPATPATPAGPPTTPASGTPPTTPAGGTSPPPPTDGTPATPDESTDEDIPGFGLVALLAALALAMLALRRRKRDA